MASSERLPSRRRRDSWSANAGGSWGGRGVPSPTRSRSRATSRSGRTRRTTTTTPRANASNYYYNPQGVFPRPDDGRMVNRAYDRQTRPGKKPRGAPVSETLPLSSLLRLSSTPSSAIMVCPGLSGQITLQSLSPMQSAISIKSTVSKWPMASRTCIGLLVSWNAGTLL